MGAMRADFRTSLEAAFARIERSASVSPADPGQFPSSTTLPDGALVARERLATVGKVALDLVAYASSGLVVGGILSYPDDGNRHSTVIHVHGGLGGIFANADGDMVQTLIDWAQRYGRTAFAPSLRGQDGSEGSPELCLGEADDVAAAAVLLRSLKVTDPDRIAIVGGSTGGCVVLRAGPLIPGLRAVVSFVPPTDWKNLVAFHRSSYAPATETRCDGSTYAWDIGGPALADVFDNMICGHVGCSDADYHARSRSRACPSRRLRPSSSPRDPTTSFRSISRPSIPSCATKPATPSTFTWSTPAMRRVLRGAPWTRTSTSTGRTTSSPWEPSDPGSSS
ncbi:MAG: alpha/beta fold hydrolase [Holophagales bacterium]|nr:alpha/beta fold hydrolase [Holophagales bacterium]